jgi:hypothetical protein
MEELKMSKEKKLTKKKRMKKAKELIKDLNKLRLSKKEAKKLYG